MADMANPNSSLDKLQEQMEANIKRMSQSRPTRAVEPMSAEQQEGGAADEGAFWMGVKANGFEVPTRGTSGNPIAGRWQRKLAQDDRLREEYNAAGNRQQKARHVHYPHM